MNRKLVYILIALLALGSPLAASAETTKATPVAVAAPAPTETAPQADMASVPMTLIQRKAFLEKNLRAVQAQFALLITRTQLTIDRLTAKGVDTTKATTELTLATTALDATKKNIELFAALVVTDDQKDTTELKKSLETLEENLKQVRTHLIESLTTLKSSVSSTVEAVQ